MYSFSDRAVPVTDKDMGNAFCLDALLDIKTYEEIDVLLGNQTEDKSSKKGGKKSKDIDCPQGEVFGYDFDSMSECDECDVRKKCKKAYKKINK